MALVHIGRRLLLLLLQAGERLGGVRVVGVVAVVVDDARGRGRTDDALVGVVGPATATRDAAPRCRLRREVRRADQVLRRLRKLQLLLLLKMMVIMAPI